MDGKLAIVTGATSGIGLETSKVLASIGVTVILAGRNEHKGKLVLEEIIQKFPSAKVCFLKLDLGQLSSVKAFADEIRLKYTAVDILINNAGIQTNLRQVTNDGFENTFQTNHLSHFVLTNQLLPKLRRSSAPRVINVSSLMAKWEHIDLQDLMSDKRAFVGWKVYARSKLCNLLFTNELQKRSDYNGWNLLCISVNPGFTKTQIVTKEEPNEPFLMTIGRLFFTKFLGPQDVKDGAKSTLFAATADNLKKGGFYGPQGLFECRGPIGLSSLPKNVNFRDAEILWNISCDLTSTVWPIN